MHPLTAGFSAIILLFGSPLIAVAQSPSPNGAAVLETVPRPVEDFSPSNSTLAPASGRLVIEDPTNVGVVLQQLNDRTQLVLSPAKDDLRRWDTNGSGLSGDNKVQVVYGLQER